MASDFSASELSDSLFRAYDIRGIYEDTLTLEAARLMVLRGAWAIDADHPEKTKWCAMAKRMATDACFQIADEALQLHGGYGYMNEYPIAQLYKDARVQRIYGGTNEIMKLLIARTL